MGPILLTWANFNPSMDKQPHAQESLGWNYLSISNFKGATIEVQEWMSNFIPHFIWVQWTVLCLCALFSIFPQFYVPFYVKKKKMDNFMYL